MLPTKFQVNWPFGSVIDFQDGCQGGHLGIPIGIILAIFDLQVTPMLPTKFQVTWPFGSGKEAKTIFSRWSHGGHLGFLIRRILTIFDLQITPMIPTKFQAKWPAFKAIVDAERQTLHDG